MILGVDCILEFLCMEASSIVMLWSGAFSSSVHLSFCLPHASTVLKWLHVSKLLSPSYLSHLVGNGCWFWFSAKWMSLQSSNVISQNGGIQYRWVSKICELLFLISIMAHPGNDTRWPRIANRKSSVVDRLSVSFPCRCTMLLSLDVFGTDLDQ